MKRLILNVIVLGTMSFVYADSSGGLSGPDKIDARNGADIYAASCAACHMPNGKGATGAGFYPSLVDNDNLKQEAYPEVVVLYGLHAMPAFGGVLDDEQIANVINYVRNNFEKVDSKLTQENITPLRDPNFEFNDLN